MSERNNPRNAARYVANYNKLPEKAYALHPSLRTPIVIDRGEDGFIPVTVRWTDEALSRSFVKEQNQKLGVTSAQAAAMLNGSLFGFDTPGADPDHAINQEQDLA